METSSDFLLRIFSIAQIELRAGEWRAESVFDPFWRFYVNERDGFEVFCDGETSKTVALRENTAYIIPAQTLFSGRNTAASRHFYIHFDVVGALPFAACGETAPVIEVALSDAMRCALLEPLSDATPMTAIEAHGSRATFLPIMRARALLHAIFAASLEQGVMRSRETNPALTAIQPALDFMERHIHQRLSNRVLAQQCRFSTDHFIEVFRCATGTTPAQFLMERRLSVAAQQLLFSNDKLETIAQATGFCDRFHLSRAFKKRFGQTPVAYRNTRLV